MEDNVTEVNTFNKEDNMSPQDSKRGIDNMLISSIDNIQKSLTILQQNHTDLKDEMQKQNSSIDKNLSLLTQSINDKVIPLVNKHESALYGKQDNPGETGLIADSTKVKRDFKNTKVFLGVVGSVMTVLLTIIINFDRFVNFFVRR